jgi:thymidylate kinase
MIPSPNAQLLTTETGVGPVVDLAPDDPAPRTTAAPSPGEVVARALDDVVEGTVLVVGSPPPGGRDLDLVADPADVVRIQAWLAGAGYVAWRQTWVCLADADSYVVEVVGTDRWGSRDDASSLFTGAAPLPGMRHLSTPDAATWLLLAARGTVRRRGQVTDKVRRRVSEALESDPGAWEVAADRARPLGLLGAVTLLRRAYDAEHALPPKARAAALAGVLTASGPLPARLRTITAARPRQLRPVIVAFAGTDGAGKSTQADLLAARLKEIGVPTERRWSGFKTAKQLRARLPLLDRKDPAAEPREHDRIMPAALHDSPVGRQVWVTAVVAVNVLHLWRVVLRRRPGTSVLVFDRSTPDAAVKMEFHFAHTRGIDIRVQRWLFDRLTPRPDVAVWVDVPAEVAAARRPEEPLERLTTMRAHYGHITPRYGLNRVDGTHPRDALANEVANLVWRELP